MDAARKILLFDSLLGTVWIVTGLSVAASREIASVWWLVGVGGLAAVGLLAAEEHGHTPADSLRWFGVTIVGVLVVGVVTVVATTSLFTFDATVAIGAHLVGLGVGLLGYRLLYGLVWPIPDAGLDRARERAV